MTTTTGTERLVTGLRSRRSPRSTAGSRRTRRSTDRGVGDRHLPVLPRPYDPVPADVAAHLLDAGADLGLSALVFERVVLPGSGPRGPRTLGDLATDEPALSDLSILVVRRR